ncbi:unnamed protein product [Owenia fusiformis]|uniref:Uncharacterized protein n=1 Tax=Owenia fusiformis TaxID=6347 RepID=A0A8J1TGT0_OWEFU|nr:unnamed protein product [Owenia fusiformis]
MPNNTEKNYPNGDTKEPFLNGEDEIKGGVIYKGGKVHDTKNGIVDEDPADEALFTKVQKFSVTDPEETPERKKKLFRYNLIKTICLLLAWVANGMMWSVKVPTIPDLKERTGTDYNEIGIAVSLRAMGWIMASPIAGYIFDRFPRFRDMQLATGFILEAISVILKPWASNFQGLTFLYWMEGFAHGLYGLVGNAMIIDMWQEDTSPPLHAMHFGWGFGAFIAPMIARPFLGTRPEDEEAYNSTNFYNSSQINASTATSWMNVLTDVQNVTVIPTDIRVNNSHIEVPYIVIGCYGIFIGILFLAYQYLIPKPKLQKASQAVKKSWREVISPKQCTQGQTSFGLIMLFLGFLFYSGVDAQLAVIGTYSSAIAYEDLNFSKQKAALLAATASASSIGFRFITMIITKWCPMWILIYFELFTAFAMSVCLVTVGLSDPVLYWVFTCVLLSVTSPLWPGMMAWAEPYMEVTGSVVALWGMGAGITGFGLDIISGWVFQNLGSQASMVQTCICSSFMIALIIVIKLVMLKYGEKDRGASKQKNNHA